MDNKYKSVEDAREIHKDVSDTIKACWVVIGAMVGQYDPKYRFILSSRVINTLWAQLFNPVIKTVVKTEKDKEDGSSKADT